jgi:GNAT superfamily N-acetyltransferase
VTEAARPAVLEEVDQLAELVAQGQTELTGRRGGPLWAQRDAAHPLDAAALAALVTDPDALVLVGTFDGVVVGYAIVQPESLRDGTTLAVIDGLYVEPAARGVGVGEALMDAVVSWSESKGCRGIDGFALPGDRETKNFFERFGLTARAILVHRSLLPVEEASGADA